jgi:hypothetical protein
MEEPTMSVNYYLATEHPIDGLNKDDKDDPGIHLGQWSNGRFLAAAHGDRITSLDALLTLAARGRIVPEHYAPTTFADFVQMVVVESKPRPHMVEADFWADGVPFCRGVFH